MIVKTELEKVRDTLTDSSISHVAIRCDRALQMIDKAIMERDVTLPVEIAYLLKKAIDAKAFSNVDAALATIIIDQLKEYE
jgi:hypothetical protein